MPVMLALFAFFGVSLAVALVAIIRADKKDIPEVLRALGELLEHLRPFR